MSLDPAQMKQRLLRMVAVSLGLTAVAVGFGIAHFAYGVSWALWGFVGFLGLGFAAQIWFIRGLARDSKGN
ncbi:hypothetical protein [Phenylobacterium sp.]|uniref:hypothetical protein n=1 Tax=Phenylobacterium sp. TaxID=1871053 RepID=UPI0025F9CE71|nr:hypothetical protein [Phenylobacterium sp.]